MPGHTNAALSSYAELNCNGQAPAPFTGTDVGFSSLCVEEEVTYRFIDDVVGEIAALTPGPYFHMGGDEVKTLKPEQYKAFVERVQKIVQKHGKEMIGWDEIAPAALLPTTIVQHWRPDAAKADLARAPHLIMSPANRIVPGHEVRRATPRSGCAGRGSIPVKTAYDWDPAALVPAIGRTRFSASRRRCGPRRSRTMRDAEFMAMPRLAAIAELGWSPRESRDWERFRVRLGAPGARAGRQWGSISTALRRCRGSSPRSPPTTWDGSPSAWRRRRRSCAPRGTRCTAWI